MIKFSKFHFKKICFAVRSYVAVPAGSVQSRLPTRLKIMVDDRSIPQHQSRVRMAHDRIKENTR